MERFKRNMVLDDGRVSQLLRLMQDTAGIDARLRGAGMAVLTEKGCTWVIIKMNLDIQRMPKVGEEVEICSWPMKGRLAIYPRVYEIRDCEGNMLISGRSTWAIMDTTTRSLVSGESRGININGEEEGERFKPQRRISIPEGGKVFDLTPTEDQIDRNGHMNNAAYLDAVEPMLPDEFKGRKLESIAVDYEREILPGRHASVRAVAQGDCCFFEGSMDGRVCFRISERFSV